MNWTIAFALLALASGAGAATLEVTIKDAREAPVEDAVVYAVQKSGARADRAQRPAAVAQKDKQFAPPVSVVQAGTSVLFPNRDPFRHHVYSFSPAKVFEIKLYAGTPADPVVFDKPGEVVLGCNIHDNMVGYIYVVDSPFFAKTDKEGRARLEGLPAGDYEIRAWHFAQSSQPAPRAMALKGEETTAPSFSVALKAIPPRPTAN
jgi:plastocyanin